MSRLLVCMVLSVLFFTKEPTAATIYGRVTEVASNLVKIAFYSEWLPQPGDAVEIFFSVPGLDDTITVARGTVTKVFNRSVIAEIQQAYGGVEANHQAKISSATPQKRNATAGPETAVPVAVQSVTNTQNAAGVGATTAAKSPVPVPVTTTEMLPYPPAPATPPQVTAADPPEFVPAHKLFLEHRHQEALIQYNVALQHMPNHRASLYERGTVQLWLNEVPGALQDWTTLANLDPSDVEIRRLQTSLEMVAGDPRKALEQAKELLQLIPTDPNILLLYAQTALYAQDLPAAQRSFALAARLNPSLASLLYDQGNQFLTAGVPALAYQLHASVLYLDPKMVGAHYGLGLAAARLGQRDRALKAFTDFLRYDSTSPFAEQARQQIERLKTGR